MSAFAWLPQPIRTILGRLRGGGPFRAQKAALRKLSGRPIKKIIVGSAGIPFEGGVATDREVIDLLRQETWRVFFGTDSIDAILGEHVWEHLAAEDAVTAARTCYRFLKPGGYLRVAVPDGLHPDPLYVEAVKPGGTGAGSDDHKVLYNYSSFRDVFANVGFDVRLYEYFDEQGQFHFREWDTTGGMIQRSKRYDPRNSEGRLAYTSIVLDAIKPNQRSS